MSTVVRSAEHVSANRLSGRLPSKRRHGEPAEQLSLLPDAMGVLLTGIDSGDIERERPARLEVFTVGRDREVVRAVTRANGAVARSVVGKLPGKIWRLAPTEEDLRQWVDEQFLTRAVAPPSEGDGDLQRESEEVRVCDMFAGCGAMSLGVAEACRALGIRFRMAGAFETDEIALSVFCRNFGGPEPVRDVEAVLRKRVSSPRSQAEKSLVRDLGRVDVLVAGPPCQGHSNLNNNTRRRDPKNELYYRVARFARLFKPRLIIVENVQAVLHDAGNVVDRTRRALTKLGYTIDDAIVRLADIGVPQTRRRHILVAVRSGYTSGQPLSIGRIVSKFRVPHRPVLWAIRDLVNQPPDGLFNTAATPSADTQRRIKWLFDNKAYELANEERPKCQQGEHRYTAVYGRMRATEPAPTITGGYDTMGRGRFVHPTRRRTITPHEAARIQFFPDFFDFSAALGARARLAQVIGNAVPPKLSYVLALELLR